MRSTRRKSDHGLTLIELLVGLAIVAVVAAIAVPALTGWLDQHRLRAAATVIQGDLRLAQSEAQKRQRNLAVSISASTDGDVWCLGWSLAGGCDCRQPASCQIDGVERVVHGHEWPGIRLLPGISGGTFGFNPVRGTVTAGNVTLRDPDGRAIRVIVHGMGRIRTCVPVGAPEMAGLPTC